MPDLRQLLTVVNPPGTEGENIPTQRHRGRRYLSWLQVALGVLRVAWPVPHLFGWAAVLRHADVREVLSRPDVFRVPFDEEVARLNDGAAPGTPFLLGIDDVAAHDAQQVQVMQAFRREDARNLVAPIARRSAEAIVAGAQGSLECIHDLITRVPIDLCVEYYGVPVRDPRQFGDAAIDVSGHLFGPPPIRPGVDAQGRVLRDVVDDAIAAARKRPPGGTVIERLVNTALTDREIRAFLIGMIVGFVPTNTRAGGHILDMLLAHPEFMEEARHAALQGDGDLLAHCLFEALRFMPINPGPFRVCEKDHVVAAGTPHATRIRKGTRVLASTASAMFDCRAVDKPFQYIPSRPASNFMHFGFGSHWCVGFHIARAQLVETFRALLVKEGLKRARHEGRLARRGGFPDRLRVEYQP